MNLFPFLSIISYCMCKLSDEVPENWVCESCSSPESSGKEDTLRSPYYEVQNGATHLSGSSKVHYDSGLRTCIVYASIVVCYDGFNLTCAIGHCYVFYRNKSSCSCIALIITPYIFVYSLRNFSSYDSTWTHNGGHAQG